MYCLKMNKIIGRMNCRTCGHKASCTELRSFAENHQSEENSVDLIDSIIAYEIADAVMGDNGQGNGGDERVSEVSQEMSEAEIKEIDTDTSHDSDSDSSSSCDSGSDCDCGGGSSD